VPACVLASTEHDVLAFLTGLFQGSATLGTTEANLFKYTTPSRQLARQVQILLLHLGLPGTLWSQEDEARYHLTLDADQVLDLLDLLPSLRTQVTTPLREPRADRQPAGHLHTCRALLPPVHSVSHTRTALAEQATPAASTPGLHYLWLPVRGVRPAGVEPVYDLLVPATHSFVADGFVQHNSQDISELVGGIDLSTIGEVGVESDPRAYRFDGELNIANRGVMEFVEMLKCRSGDSLVFTQHGIRQLDSLAQPGHTVGESRDIALQLSTGSGVETAAQLYRAGLSKTRRITTRHGFLQEGTPEHRTQVVDQSGALVWQRLDQVQPGDWVVLQKGQNLWGQDVRFDWQGAPLEQMTPELARWLGYLLAAGELATPQVVTLNCSEAEIVSDILHLTERLFGVRAQHTAQQVTITSAGLVDFLHSLGAETGPGQQIPWSVLQSSRESVLAFLTGYFASNGSVHPNGRLCWNSASEQLAHQLQIVLLNLGVVCGRVMTRRQGAENCEAEQRWTVTATGAEARRLAASMRILPQRKLLACTRIPASAWSTERADPVPHTSGYWQSMLDELHTSVMAQVQACGENNYPAARQPLDTTVSSLQLLGSGTYTCTRERASRVLSRLEGWIEPPPGLGTLLNPSLFYDQVVTLADGEAECWDLYVPGSNTFIANGFVNHNCDEKFLYVLLTLSQEQNIKTGRFSMIYADEVVVSHTNEHEYQSFVGNKKSEALQDRIILVKVPYNLRVSDEIKIYEKLLKQSSLQNVHIAPYTLRIASIFAVLTRLEASKKAGMSLMKKLKLYDGEDMEDFKQKDVRELQEEAQREGMDGISPRYVINRLSSALVKQNTTCINPIDALRALRDGLDQHTSITREERERYLNFISEARKEYDEMAKKEVQRAFVYSYEESARTLLNNYLDNVEAYCNKTKLRDPITDEEMEPDEPLMRSIEEQIGVSETAKKSFREEILIRISSLARKGLTFDYTSHERLKEAIEKKLFADLRDVVKITTSARTPDAEQLRKINDVVNRLMSEHGYCHVCANEILRYTGSLLNR
jgi:hypothetical protein